MKTTTFVTALILTAGLGTGMAQEQRNIEYHRVQTFASSGGEAGPAGKIVTAGPGTFFFESSEMAFDGAVVKGSPYSADAVTETAQTLTDGNRIHRTSKATLYRDSDGRTRREQTLGELGPLVASGDPIQTIAINDPVAETTYMLNTHEKIAHKLPGKGMMGVRAGEMMAKMKHEAEHGAMAVAGGVVTSAGPAPGQPAFAMSVRRADLKATAEGKNLKKESLGTQMIEGVAADGTKTTMTIPAGAIGNERAIDIVTETWYSSQLHTTVMTKTTDPRSGETVYSLKNIKLVEPAGTLFQVPADYTVQ
jgi:hypothetical protein